jgi:hypothetical protein
MSDAPGQVADAPLIVVLVDSTDTPEWVSGSVAALSQRHPQTRVVARNALVESGPAAALRDAGVVIDLSRGPAAQPGRKQFVLTVLCGTTNATSRTALVRELLAGRRTVTTTVVARDGTPGAVVVAEARTALTRRSLAASRVPAMRKVPALLLRAVDTVLGPSAPTSPPGGRYEPIGPLAVGVGAARLLGDGVRSFYARSRTESRYAVAWGSRTRSDSPLELPEQMQWIDHPEDRFLADPFLARHGGQTFVFVEDFSDPAGYATIGVFEPRDPASTFRTVLDRGSHLSYPFVFRDRDSGDWLMLPEMAAENCVTLFRATSFPDAWQADAVLLDDVNAYDSTVLYRDGRYWLFYASGTNKFCFNDELLVAFSENLRGPYIPHPLNPVKSDVVGSRPAGRLFDWNGRLIRPGQDSSREYGHAVVFNEVTELTPTTFAERPIGRLEPDWAPGIRSTHSWDFLDDIVVADAKRIFRR